MPLSLFPPHLNLRQPHRRTELPLTDVGAHCTLELDIRVVAARQISPTAGSAKVRAKARFKPSLPTVTRARKQMGNVGGRKRTRWRRISPSLLSMMFSSPLQLPQLRQLLLAPPLNRLLLPRNLKKNSSRSHRCLVSPALLRQQSRVPSGKSVKLVSFCSSLQNRIPHRN